MYQSYIKGLLNCWNNIFIRNQRTRNLRRASKNPINKLLNSFSLIVCIEILEAMPLSATLIHSY
jgi:hypothetical protein